MKGEKSIKSDVSSKKYFEKLQGKYMWKSSLFARISVYEVKTTYGYTARNG